jgi:hypothetical protein
MTPDAATVIAYSGGLFALIFVFFLFSSRKAGQAWYGLPFAFGSVAAILLVHPAMLPGMWSGRLAVFAFCSPMAQLGRWRGSRAGASHCCSPRSLIARRGSASLLRSCMILTAGRRSSPASFARF